ncbi:hypothetical protein TKK_0012233 [Trichogramma kaykai]|uniref:DUF4219 domain-containing protein n=1 Tax=Trichogramma kaykai TaxID=54128 RepID=A0ABD2WN65_9HYME
MERELEQIDKLVNRDQWPLWKFKITVTLKSYDVWSVVQGSQDKSQALGETATSAQVTSFEKEKHAYERADGIAQKIIVKMCSDKVLIHILNRNCAKEMWDKLMVLYDRKSEVAVNTLQQSWCNYVKDPADDIDTHISKIENMTFKLNVMDLKCSDQDVICKILNTLQSFPYIMCDTVIVPSS